MLENLEVPVRRHCSWGVLGWREKQSGAKRRSGQSQAKQRGLAGVKGKGDQIFHTVLLVPHMGIGQSTVLGWEVGGGVHQSNLILQPAWVILSRAEHTGRSGRAFFGGWRRVRSISWLNWAASLLIRSLKWNESGTLPEGRATIQVETVLKRFFSFSLQNVMPTSTLGGVSPSAAAAAAGSYRWFLLLRSFSWSIITLYLVMCDSPQNKHISKTINQDLSV